MTESRSLPVSCAEAGKSYIQKYKRSVQWHPEMLIDTDAGTKRLFEEFIEAANQYHNANSLSFA